MNIKGIPELVHRVTMRAYCKCGDAYHTTSDLEGAIDNIIEFWIQHPPETPSHGPTTPEKARYARKKRLSSRTPIAADLRWTCQNCELPEIDPNVNSCPECGANR